MTKTTQIDGKWLNVTNPIFCNSLEIMVFGYKGLSYYGIEGTGKRLCFQQAKTRFHFEEHSTYHFDLISSNRMRLYRKGKECLTYRNEHLVCTTRIYEEDYIKLIPTEIKIPESRVSLLRYRLDWKEKDAFLQFDQNMDNPALFQINELLDRNSRRLFLEKIENTFLITLYNHQKMEWTLPIKEIDENKAVLYGLPQEPYQVNLISEGEKKSGKVLF